MNGSAIVKCWFFNRDQGVIRAACAILASIDLQQPFRQQILKKSVLIRQTRVIRGLCHPWSISS
jgi:hypothetical protein